jgi:small conductance mechanosensitive channel
LLQPPPLAGAFSLLVPRGIVVWPRQARLKRFWSLVLAVALLLAGAGAWPALAQSSAGNGATGAAGTEAPSTAEDSERRNAGSYEVAPVRILGIPAIVVASPQIHNGDGVIAASRRARLIEANLRLIYQPQLLCSAAERISEQLLKSLVLQGTSSEGICSDIPWLVDRDQASKIRLETRPGPSGGVVIQARLPDRPRPMPLLTVTAADAQLHGTSTQRLADRWRKVLEERLQHARYTLQPEQFHQRLRAVLVAELLLMLGTVLCLRHWSRLRRRLNQLQSEALRLRQSNRTSWQLIWASRLSFALLMLQLVLMLGLAFAAIPGNIPLAVTVMMQPLEILFKTAAVASVVFCLQVVMQLLLRQWRSNPDLPWEQLERRQQRYNNLLQAGHRLLNLGGALLLVILVLSGLPGAGSTPLSTWLAGGALLGGLAIVFQGLLRDFVAGLIVLFEDHYAIGDCINVDGLQGIVEDVGLLATSLRTLDQCVVVIPNSGCDRVVNLTRIRSGVDVTIPLPAANPQLETALRVVTEEVAAFASDPQWTKLLLHPPDVRGVRRITPLAVELSVLLVTHAGDQWAAERALLGRIVMRFEREGLSLAHSELAAT